MESLLETIDLCAGYQKGFDIVKHINLTLKEGEVFGIVGKNGCGKSTLAKALVGFTPFRSGDIVYRGKSVMQQPVEQMKSLGISIMQQGGRVLPNLTVWENFQLAAKHIGNDEVKQEIIEMIPLLHEKKHNQLHKYSNKLSGGERHQLALAMTLATARDFIILDEPSAGLSPTAIVTLYDILRKVCARFNATILLVEQNVKQAEDFASTLAFMDNGKITYQGNDINIIEELMYK